MKLKIKTLQQQQFEVEANDSDPVIRVKEIIESQQGFPVASQKIIYSGKVLADDKPLSEYNISEKDFLVVMVTKAVKVNKHLYFIF